MLRIEEGLITEVVTFPPEGLGRIGATINDMVHVLPASKRTLAERMADHDGDFRIAYEKGRALLNSSLRRKQIAVAMAGNVTMLIWLGKQHLAQHDRVEVDMAGLDATMDKFIAAGTKAREAGDHAGLQSVLDAIDRIGHGESAEMVYLEWLRAQQPAGGDSGDAGR